MIFKKKRKYHLLTCLITSLLIHQKVRVRPLAAFRPLKTSCKILAFSATMVGAKGQALEAVHFFPVKIIFCRRISLFHIVILLKVVANFSHILTQIQTLKYISKATSGKFGHSVALSKLLFPALEMDNTIVSYLLPKEFYILVPIY